MELDRVELGRRLEVARERAGVNQTQAGAVIGVSQPTYHRIEQGKRALRGDELVRLADRFGVRASALSGLTQIRERARFAARTDGTAAPMTAMRERLYTYLELDSYLTDQGIAGA